MSMQDRNQWKEDMGEARREQQDGSPSLIKVRTKCFKFGVEVGDPKGRTLGRLGGS